MDVAKNILTNRWRLTFEVDRMPAVDTLSGKDLRITAKQWREKRSLNSNSYAHLLLGKIAEETGISLTAAKNRLMAEYGQYETNDDGTPQTVILRDDIPWESLEWMHLKPTTKTKYLDDKRLYRVYLVIKGSHTYDTKEMSRLISGIVEEAKQLGIETMTPAELQAMNLAWRPQ